MNTAKGLTNMKKDLFIHNSPSTLQNIIKKPGGLLETIHPLILKIVELNKSRGVLSPLECNSQEYIRSFIENAPVATALIDSKFYFQATSSAWNKWFIKYFLPKKEKRTTLNGCNFYDLIERLPTLSIILDALKANLKGKSLRYKLLEISVPYGDTRWIRWESFPWGGADHPMEGIVIFTEDVTDLQKLYLDNQNLHGANEMLQNFSLIFSHDLIQPLRQISNHMYFIEQRLKKELGESFDPEEMLAPVKKCVQQARELCEGIVFYCRGGDFTVKRERVALAEILKKISETCLEHTNVIFRNLLDPTLQLVANKTSLLQLFQNLLDNAIKHSTTTQPIITLSGKKLRENIFQFHLHNDSYCPKSIKRKNVFNAFESSKYNGAGLGLMICKKIVTAYGGKITLRSSKTKGTTIQFTLPFCDSDALADEQYQSNMKGSGESVHKNPETKKISEYNHWPVNDKI
jgi:signal transduction histidine kinase